MKRIKESDIPESVRGAISDIKWDLILRDIITENQWNELWDWLVEDER